MMMFGRKKPFEGELEVAHHQALPKNCFFYWPRYTLHVEVNEASQVGQSKYCLLLRRMVCRQSKNSESVWWVQDSEKLVGSYDCFEDVAQVHADFGQKLAAVNEIPRLVDLTEGLLPFPGQRKDSDHRLYPLSLEVKVHLVRSQSNQPQLLFGLRAYRWHTSNGQWVNRRLEDFSSPTFESVEQLQEAFSQTWQQLCLQRLQEIQVRQQNEAEFKRSLTQRRQQYNNSRDERKARQRLQKALDQIPSYQPLPQVDPLQEEIENMQRSAQILNQSNYSC